MVNANVTMTAKMMSVMTELIPAIQAIFELGCFPTKDKIVEFDEEMYRLAETRIENFEKPLYHVRSGKENIANQPVNTFRAHELRLLEKGLAFFNDYIEKNKLQNESDDSVLKHASENLPRLITTGTPYERPLLKLATGNEKSQTEREEIMTFLAQLTGENENEMIKVVHKDADGIEREEIIAPTIETTSREKRLNFKKFKKATLRRLTEFFKDEAYKVTEEIARKNDDTAYEVIRVSSPMKKIGIGLAINDYYKRYASGETFEATISAMVADVTKNEDVVGKIEIPEQSFESLKDKIIVRPLNFKNNQQMLDDYVYQRHGDIALVIYMALANNISFATAKIHKKTVEQWDMSEKELFDWAITNTQNLYPPYLIPSDFLITGKTPETYPAINKYFMNPDFIFEKSKNGSYHLFLDVNVNAATAVFYDGTLKKIAELVNDDLYLVIASMSFVVVHESKTISLARLKRVAMEEKSSPHADPAEFLSDGVYHYSRRTGRLELMYHKIAK